MEQNPPKDNAGTQALGTGTGVSPTTIQKTKTLGISGPGSNVTTLYTFAMDSNEASQELLTSKGIWSFDTRQLLTACEQEFRCVAATLSPDAGHKRKPLTTVARMVRKALQLLELLAQDKVPAPTSVPSKKTSKKGDQPSNSGNETSLQCSDIDTEWKSIVASSKPPSPLTPSKKRKSPGSLAPPEQERPHLLSKRPRVSPPDVMSMFDQQRQEELTGFSDSEQNILM